MNSKEIIKYLKNSIDEKGNYCYSLPIETTKAIIKCIEEKDKEIGKLNKTLEKAQQEYTDEYNLRHKLSLELSAEKDKVLELSHHLTLYSSEETMLKEIERLNNIINELEKYLVERIEYNQGSELQDYLENTYSMIYSVLQELKGDSSNE